MPDLVESSKSNIADGYNKAVSFGRRLPKMLTTQKASETVTLRFCYNCGAVLSNDFKPGNDCPACERAIEAIANVPPGYSNNSSETARLKNQQKLENEALKWLNKGFVVVRQTSHLIELRKPKRFSEKWAVAWLIAGIPFPGMALAYAGGYAVWHVVRKEQSVLLTIESDGTLQIEKNSDPI